MAKYSNHTLLQNYMYLVSYIVENSIHHYEVALQERNRRDAVEDEFFFCSKWCDLLLADIAYSGPEIMNIIRERNGYDTYSTEHIEQIKKLVNY